MIRARLWQALVFLVILSTTGCGLLCDRYCDRCYGHRGHPCCYPAAPVGQPMTCVCQPTSAPVAVQQPWTPTAPCK